MKGSLKALCLLAVLSLFTVACARPTPTPAPATPAPAPATPVPQVELKVGVGAPLTGPAAGYGLPFQRASQLITDKWNKAGGLLIGGKRYIIKPIVEDTKYTGPGTRAVVEKFIFEDKVKYMFIFGSTPAAVAAPIAQENKVIMFGFGSATSKIIGKDRPYVFNTLVGREMFAIPLWKWVKENLKVQNIVYMYPNDDAGRAGIAMARKWVPEMGMKLVGEFLFEREDTDFYSQITKANALNPDLIYFTGSSGQSALFAKQSHELGTKAIRMVIAISADEAYEVAGEGAEGIYVAIGTPTSGPALTKEFVELHDEYVKRFGRWDILVDQIVGSWNAFRAAWEKAGTVDDLEKVIRVIPETTPHHPLGDGRWIGGELWGADHQIVWPAAIVQLKGGEPVGVGIIDSDTFMWGYQQRVKEAAKG